MFDGGWSRSCADNEVRSAPRIETNAIAAFSEFSEMRARLASYTSLRFVLRLVITPPSCFPTLEIPGHTQPMSVVCKEYLRPGWGLGSLITTVHTTLSLAPRLEPITVAETPIRLSDSRLASTTQAEPLTFTLVRVLAKATRGETAIFISLIQGVKILVRKVARCASVVARPRPTYRASTVQPRHQVSRFTSTPTVNSERRLPRCALRSRYATWATAPAP